MPTLTLVAGPNGFGKGTLSAAIAGRGTIVVDPDTIAREIDTKWPADAAVAAARRAILRCRSMIETQTNFVVEGTLAGNGAISLMREAKSLRPSAGSCSPTGRRPDRLAGYRGADLGRASAGVRLIKVCALRFRSFGLGYRRDLLSVEALAVWDLLVLLTGVRAGEMAIVERMPARPEVRFGQGACVFSTNAFRRMNAWLRNLESELQATACG